MTRFLAGFDVNKSQASNQMVIQLANHVSQLHGCQYTTWGHVQKPALSALDWSSRLQQVLLTHQQKMHLQYQPSILTTSLIKLA